MAKAPGLSCVKLKGQEECCGFGGTFSVRMPEISAAMLKKKLDHIVEAKSNGADCVVSNDLGCLMNMQTAAQKAGMKMDFKHVVELFNQDTANAKTQRRQGNP